ncbi:hypothetical protein P9112_002585 [Eukaryota sp. TZLM1-RC]
MLTRSQARKLSSKDIPTDVTATLAYSHASTTKKPKCQTVTRKRRISTKMLRNQKRMRQEEPITNPFPTFPVPILNHIAYYLAKPNLFWTYEDMLMFTRKMSKISNKRIHRLSRTMWSFVRESLPCTEEEKQSSTLIVYSSQFTMLFEEHRRMFASTATKTYGVTEKYLCRLECEYVENPYYKRAAPGRLYDRSTIRRIAREIHGSPSRLNKKREKRRRPKTY